MQIPDTIIRQLADNKLLVAEVAPESSSSRCWIAIYPVRPGSLYANLNPQALYRVQHVEVSGHYLDLFENHGLDLTYDHCEIYEAFNVSDAAELANVLDRWLASADELVQPWQVDYPF